MAEFLYYNPNPSQRYRRDGSPIKSDHNGDCTVRCITKALDIDWETAYKKLCDEGLKQHRMPDDMDVVKAVLESNGFKKGTINKEYIKRHHHRPTVSSAVDDIKTIDGLKDKKKFVFQNTHHVTTVDDGVIFDTWDTSEECVWSFWYK